MATAKKIAASQNNGRQGHGPKDTTATRWNALKHALTAKGLTELDDLDTYERTVADLTLRKKPVGPIEEGLVRFAAVYMAKWQHAQVMTAEYVTSQLHHAKYEHLAYLGDAPLDPGFTPTLSLLSFENLPLYQRYETTHANAFFRVLHELERIQRLRQGEYVPAASAVDVSVTGVELVKETSAAQATMASNVPTVTVNVDHQQIETAGAESEQRGLPGDGGNPGITVADKETSAAQATMASNVPTVTVNVDHQQIETAGAESEQRGLPGDGGNPAINVSVSDGSAHNAGMSSSAPPAQWQKADPRPFWFK